MKSRVIRTVVFSVVMLGVSGSLAACEPMSSAELGREVESLASLAAEGSVLAERIATQNTKRTFARVHARELGDAAEHSAERLTDAHPAEGLEDDVTRAISLAERIADQIGQLEVAPDSADAAALAGERLRALDQAATDLAGSL